MTLRSEAPSDYDAIREVVTLAFGQPDEARLVDALRDAEGFDTALSLVAEDAGRIVGHALLTGIRIETAGASRPALALAPVSVLPERQRQGIGSALIWDLLRRAEERGHGVVIVLGHAEYYPRFGFVPASRFGIHPPFDVPDEAFLALELSSGCLNDCVGIVRYPPAFGV